MSTNTYVHEGYQPGYSQGLPTHVPAVVHKQYNSPLPLYSTENVAEALATQTEALTNGAVGVNFHAIGTPVLKRSEVYRMVQEEQRQTTTSTRTVHGQQQPQQQQQSTSSPEPTFQSQSFIRIQRTLDESGRPISPTSPTPGSDDRRGAPAVPLSGTGPQAQSVPKHVAEQQRYSAAPNQPPYYQQQPPLQQQQQQQYYQQRIPDYNQQPQHRREPTRQQQYPQQQATPPPRARPQSPPHQYPGYKPAPQQEPSEYRPPQYQQQPQHPYEYRPPQQQQPSDYRPPQQQQADYRPPPPQPQQQQPPSDYRPPPQQPQQQKPPPTSPSTPKRKVVATKQDPYRYTASGTGYQAPPMNSVSPPSGRRRPVWPPQSSVPALQTSTQSIHWIGSKGQKKFVWPPPKAYTSYEYDDAVRHRDNPMSLSEAQERADSFISPKVRNVPRSHPRAPARLAAQAWEPYLGPKDEMRNPLFRRNPRKTRRFEEVITMSNSTRLPPTYRPPPGTQHITLDYEFESEEEEEEEEED